MAATDALLNRDPAAVLIGMLLDQQVPMEWAFAGPATLLQRLGSLDPVVVAGLGQDAVVTAACAKPAVHRYPAVMGRRIHALAVALTERFGGDAAAVWRDAADGHDLYRRLRTLPGFGDEKARIMIAILGKRFRAAPAGWQDAAGVFADDEPRTIADSHDAASFATVRAWKAAARAAGRDKQGRDKPAQDKHGRAKPAQDRHGRETSVT